MYRTGSENAREFRGSETTAQNGKSEEFKVFKDTMSTLKDWKIEVG